MFFALVLLFINALGCAIVARDKRTARRGGRRTPERAFAALALLGGGFGVLAGFYLFRHKTRHRALLARVWTAALAFFAALGYLLYIRFYR